MRTVVLLRGGHEEDHEREAAQRAGFTVIRQRAAVQPGDFVVPRYSALPFFKEFENDVKLLGGTLINTYREHQFCADMREWSTALGDLTPKTWFRLQDARDAKGPFVLKGATNSMKFLWDTHMYAETFEDAVRVHSRLTADSLVGEQDIYIREYVPLLTHCRSDRGLPITREYRSFFYKTTELTTGYYWSTHGEDVPPEWITSRPPPEFLASVVEIIARHVTFFAIDVAQKQDGGWIVVEVNDGQQSGLSMNKALDLYVPLWEEVLT